MSGFFLWMVHSEVGLVPLALFGRPIPSSLATVRYDPVLQLVRNLTCNQVGMHMMPRRDPETRGNSTHFDPAVVLRAEVWSAATAEVVADATRPYDIFLFPMLVIERKEFRMLASHVDRIRTAKNLVYGSEAVVCVLESRMPSEEKSFPVV